MNADALLIGIDKYDCADIRALTGCVVDAVSAANWLTTIGVPPQRIIAHVSPADATLFPAGVDVRGASEKAIRASLTRLSRNGGGDKLFIFMSGHGKHVVGAGPIFLCQDYFVDESTRENLKIREYISWFRSWGYKDQFLFYDACQDLTASIGQLTSVQALGPDPIAGSYLPNTNVAFTACYSCSDGQTAWAGDGRGVLVRHTLNILDPGVWTNLNAAAPELDSIRYDWISGARLVDLDHLFTNIIAPKITEAATAAGNFQTPFCERLGRAAADGFSAILDLPPLPTSTVTVLVDPEPAGGDIASVRLRSQLIPHACVMPTKATPLKLPAALKFPLKDQLNAIWCLAPGSKWQAVNMPVDQKLDLPQEKVVLQCQQPPSAPPPKNDGRGEFNIIVDGGPTSLPREILEHLDPDAGRSRPSLHPGLSFQKDATGASITFDPEIAGSLQEANRIGVDWLKATRQFNQTTGNRVILSPFGVPKKLQPNIHFDFEGTSAVDLAGYLQDDECVTLESLGSDLPARRMSLRDLEAHPVEWVEPGQCRISINLPWGRWTIRIRVGDEVTRVRLPKRIGLEPLRNRLRRGEKQGPSLVPSRATGRYRWRHLVLARDIGQRWLFTAPVAMLVDFAEAGLRIEPFSETSLREWDQLLTAGRLDIDNPAGLVRRLNGKLPGGTPEEFGLFALAAGYAAYNQRNWNGLRMILEAVDDSDFHPLDLDLLHLALDIAEGRAGGSHRQRRIMSSLRSRPIQLPVLRWGSSLLADLANRIGLPSLEWLTAVEQSSVVTRINEPGLKAVGLELGEIGIPAHLNELPSIAQESPEIEIPVGKPEARINLWKELLTKEEPRGLLEGPTNKSTETDSSQPPEREE